MILCITNLPCFSERKLAAESAASNSLVDAKDQLPGSLVGASDGGVEESVIMFKSDDTGRVSPQESETPIDAIVGETGSSSMTGEEGDKEPGELASSGSDTQSERYAQLSLSLSQYPT